MPAPQAILPQRVNLICGSFARSTETPSLVFSMLLRAGVQSTDIFVITPFKVVEQEMRRRLELETDLFRALGGKVREWPRDRVGRVTKSAPLFSRH